MDTGLASRWHSRQLHLIDVENLVGTPYFSTNDVVDVRRRYDRLVKATTWDHAYVATSARSNVLDARLGWSDGLMTFTPGENGAERALLEMAPVAFAATFGRVVIASGDHFFADYASALASLGVPVLVVSRWGALSSKLRMAAKDHVYIDDVTTMPRPPHGHAGAQVAA
jgi:hypothetical protein